MFCSLDNGFQIAHFSDGKPRPEFCWWDGFLSHSYRPIFLNMACCLFMRMLNSFQGPSRAKSLKVGALFSPIGCKKAPTTRRLTRAKRLNLNRESPQLTSRPRLPSHLRALCYLSRPPVKGGWCVNQPKRMLLGCSCSSIFFYSS